MRSVDFLDDDERARILERNAVAFFGLERPALAAAA